MKELWPLFLSFRYFPANPDQPQDVSLRIMERRLKPGDKYTIPWNKTHTHANPGKTASVLKWKFKGDATDIINLIRINYGN